MFPGVTVSCGLLVDRALSFLLVRLGRNESKLPSDMLEHMSRNTCQAIVLHQRWLCGIGIANPKNAKSDCHWKTMFY